jgi:hypothetical protein
MGRFSTGAMKTASVCRIEMKHFTKWKIFKYSDCTFLLNWNDGSSISVTLINSPEEMYLNLSYTLKDRSEYSYDLNYKVIIDKVPSNLGKGFIYYFVCPITYKRCRILYRAYGSHTFRSKESYKYRLYYPAQINPKKYRIFDKKESAEDKYMDIIKGRKRDQDYFKGKRTKYSIKKENYLNRFLQLEEESSKFFLDNCFK